MNWNIEEWVIKHIPTRKDAVPHEQKPHHNNVIDIHVRMEHDC
jgi:hypothetical protein